MFSPSMLIYILLHVIDGSIEYSSEICQMVLNCNEPSFYESIVQLECSGRANLYDTYFFKCIRDGYWGRDYNYRYHQNSYIISLQILPFNYYETNNPPFQLIADHSGDTFEKFHTLIISNIKLKIIPHGFFAPFPALKSLDLSLNYLTLSDNAQLNFLPNLQSLNLSNNDICAVNHSFQNLPNLETLDLSFNKIGHLPKDFFMYQEHLNRILLNNNEIHNFDVNFLNFKDAYIKFIDLSYNKLEDIGTIANLSQTLTYLALSHNNISEFNVNLSSSVTHLDLSCNGLKEIGKYVVINAINMVSINISHNLLESLHMSNFMNMRNLKTLDISNNFLGGKKLGAYDNWLTFFLHFESLENAAFDGNMWDCDDLKDIIFSLTSRSVKIKKGSEYDKSNILGIRCIQGNTSSHENFSAEVSSNVISKVLQEVWIRLENVTRFANSSQPDKNTLNKILQVSTKMSDKEVQLNNTIEAQQIVLKDIALRLEKLEVQANSSGTHSKTNKSTPGDLNVEHRGSQIDQDTLSKILQVSTKMNDKEVQLNNTIEAQQTVLNDITSRLEKLEIQVSTSGTHSKMNQTSSEAINVEPHGSQVDTLKKIPELGTQINNSSSYLNDTLINILSSVKIMSSRLEHMEQQAKSSGAFSKNNQTYLEESTVLKNFIFSMNSLTDKIGTENKSELAQVKEELRMLKSTESGAHDGIWGEIILDLLLFAILSAMLYSLYIIVIRKTTFTREEVNLVQTL